MKTLQHIMENIKFTDDNNCDVCNKKNENLLSILE